MAMRKLNVQQIRQIQLEILDDIHRFCTENGIRYSLCGGSIIGAVRHKGYIPWDDDIDLMMPRTDYERFKSLYQSDVNELIDLSRIESCEEQFVKVSRKGTIMEDIVVRRRIWGINVDIFPIDGMPEDYLPYTKFLQDLHQSIVESCPFYKVAHKRRGYWHFRFLLKKLTKGGMKDVLVSKAELNRIALQHLPENSPLSTVIYGDFKIFPFPSQMFFELQNIEFEGKMFSCIADTDQYLSKVYGNYMELPPVEKRISHHLYDSYIFE